MSTGTKDSKLKFNDSLLPNALDDGSDKERRRTVRSQTRKFQILRILFAALCMFVLSRLRPVRICSPTFNLWCRNASSSVGPLVRGGLPTHYALPSGDSIPAVALGKLRLSLFEAVGRSDSQRRMRMLFWVASDGFA